MSTLYYCIVLPVCQTDNLQMSAPGLGGCRPEECPGNVQAAWEQEAASWPRLPLGFRDTLSDSLSVFVHAHTLRQIHQHICSCIIFTHLYVCTHACIKAGTHDFPYVHTQAWLSTLAHAHTVFIHTHSNENKNPPTLIGT